MSTTWSGLLEVGSEATGGQNSDVNGNPCSSTNRECWQVFFFVAVFFFFWVLVGGGLVLVLVLVVVHSADGSWIRLSQDRVRRALFLVSCRKGMLDLFTSCSTSSGSFVLGIDVDLLPLHALDVVSPPRSSPWSLPFLLLQLRRRTSDDFPSFKELRGGMANTAIAFLIYDIGLANNNTDYST